MPENAVKLKCRTLDEQTTEREHNGTHPINLNVVCMLISNRNSCTNTCNIIRVSRWLCRTFWLCPKLSHDSTQIGDKVSRNRHPYHFFETKNVVVDGFTLLANVFRRIAIKEAKLIFFAHEHFTWKLFRYS